MARKRGGGKRGGGRKAWTGGGRKLASARTAMASARAMGTESPGRHDATWRVDPDARRA